jgi:4,5-DOPA dioxygenase extradiol
MVSGRRIQGVKAPVLFISHGAPTFAVEPGALGSELRRLGNRLVGIKAVLVISPHWQTRAVKVMATLMPETMHDFGGFSPELYRLRYAAAGQPEIAERAALLLQRAGFVVTLDEKRGLDHGAWVPLLHLLPNAGTPVFQVSMPHDLDTRGAMQLGRALAPLRESGVLILGSGSLTHNLYEIAARASHAERYAEDFARWVRDAVTDKDTERLLSYRSQAPYATRAHPTEEHFLPLLVALGAAGDADDVLAIDGGMTYGVLSMDSFAWGLSTSRASRANGHHRAESESVLSDDVVAAICHPLQFSAPQAQP